MKHATRLLTILILCGVSMAASAETVLKFAIALPEKSPWGAQVNQFAAAVEEESEGRLRIDPYFSGQLGTSTETLAQLVRGRVEMGMFRTSIIASQVPEVEVIRMLGFFQTDAQQACTLVDHLTDDVAALLKTRGLHFGAWSDGGSSHFVAPHAIRSMDDLKGMTAGTTASRTSRDFWQALDVSPIALSISELQSAASTGMVNVMAIGYPYYVTSGVNTSLPVMSEYRFGRTSGMLLMSGGVYDSLSPEDQAALDRAFARLPLREFMAEIDALTTSLRELHISKGGEVYTPTPQEAEAFRSRLPDYWEGIVALHGDTGRRLMDVMEQAAIDCPQ